MPKTDAVESRRCARPPARYEMQQNTSSPHNFTDKERLRSEYYEAVDILIAETERRFHQSGLTQMVKLENVLATGAVRDEVLAACHRLR